MITYFPTTAICTWPDKTQVVVWVLEFNSQFDQYYITWQFDGTNKQEMWVAVEWIKQND